MSTIETGYVMNSKSLVWFTSNERKAENIIADNAKKYFKKPG
jgi:hypothetical protein